MSIDPALAGGVVLTTVTDVIGIYGVHRPGDLPVAGALSSSGEAMKILLITQEPPLLTEEVVSGNAVRTVQIRSGLEAAGHRVVQVWLATGRAGSTERTVTTFSNHDELQGILMKEEPGAVIVGYWELLAFLPHEISPPVVLDYVAPRSLEELFESPETVKSSMRRLKNNLRKCDLVLVGNPLQRHLLINTMIEAGFDLRGPDPIRVVPLGAEVAGTPVSNPEKDGWLLVSGGVSWPWRDPGSYLAELETFAAKHSPAIRLVHFGGGYRWHGPGKDEASPIGGQDGPVQFRALEPYRQFSEFLSTNAHVGVELAEWNIEREYSQSFRSLEFLRHGLPLLCNRYLPVSRLVERYEAGWIIDDPADAGANPCPASVEPGRRNGGKNRPMQRGWSSRLCGPSRSAAPLIDWLENPAKSRPAGAGRRPAGTCLARARGASACGKSESQRQFGLVRTVLLNRLFGQDRMAPGCSW